MGTRIPCRSCVQEGLGIMGKLQNVKYVFGKEGMWHTRAIGEHVLPGHIAKVSFGSGYSISRTAALSRHQKTTHICRTHSCILLVGTQPYDDKQPLKAVPGRYTWSTDWAMREQPFVMVRHIRYRGHEHVHINYDQCGR